MWLLALHIALPQTILTASADAAPVTSAPVASAAAEVSTSEQSPANISPNDRICSFNSPCEPWPVPPLLNLDLGSYGASAAQRESLRKLEGQAVANVIAGHNLTEADTDAVKTWGRYDALAELYTLIVKSIQASPRTPDQQNVADWVAAAGQQLAIGAAQAAGREYVKWAGLDRSQYDSLLNSGASQGDLKAFLQGIPLNYNNTDISTATGGWCVYRSPEPFGSDYTAWSTNPLCQGVPCTRVLGCSPPTPSYGDFVKWGQGAASYPFLNSADFQRTGGQLAKAIGIAIGAAALIPAAVITAALLVGVPSAAVIAGWAAEGGVVALTSVSPFLQALSGVAAAAAVVAAIIFAVTAAVIEGLHVISASELPGQLAELIADSYATPIDPSTLLTSSDGGTSIYTIFIGAVLPEPIPTICDNSGGLPPGVWFIGDFYELPQVLPCLNPTPIPPASAFDPQFLVKESGGTTETAASTITFEDPSGITTTARLSKTWFITQANNVTTQTLRLDVHGLGWQAAERLAVGEHGDRLCVRPIHGAGRRQTLDPRTCVSDGLCAGGDTIKYVGGDGRHYSAKVRGYLASVGTPTFSFGVKGSVGVEGAAVSFNANGFSMPNPVGPVVRTWRFQKEGCGFGTSGCMTFDPVTMQQVPAYTDALPWGHGLAHLETRGHIPGRAHRNRLPTRVGLDGLLGDCRERGAHTHPLPGLPTRRLSQSCSVL